MFDVNSSKDRIETDEIKIMNIFTEDFFFISIKNI